MNWFLFLGPPDQKLAVKKHKTFLAPKDCTCDFTYYVIFLFICHYCMIITTYLNTATTESFSCSPGWYFGTLFWDDITMFWDENLLCTYFLFQLRKIYYHNKFSSQNIVTSSQNNIPKYHPGRHEKDFRVCKKHYVEKKKVVHPIYVLSYSISSRYSKRDDYYFISINYGTYYSSDFLWRSLYYWSTLM